MFEKDIEHILKNAGVKLDEKVVRVNKELTDTKLVTSAGELNRILNNNNEARVVYDKVKNWFLVGDSENSIHTELINDALIDGYYEPFEYKGQMITGQEPDNKGGDLLYDLNPKRFILFRTSSDPLNGEDYYYDRYQNCYIYDEYCVFDRKGDFVETPLYKLLGEPEDIENLGDIDADEMLDESIFWKGEKINNYEQGYYDESNINYDPDDEMIVWKNPSAEWVKHQIYNNDQYFRFAYDSSKDDIYMWYGDMGFHMDTMEITGADGDIVGTLYRGQIDYWAEEDTLDKINDLFYSKRKEWIDIIEPNGYDIDIQV